MGHHQAEIAGLRYEDDVISKIEGTGPIRSPQQVKRTAKAGSTGGANFAKTLDEASEAEGTQATSGVNSVSGVFGIQEVDDALAHASKGKLRALDILDRLDGLRIELLSGGISRDRLLQLSQVVQARRGQITDPQLAEVLDEIDLRAQVELAKHDQSSKR
jgi:hypothetical protein